jgi:hypothetical protein
VTIFPVPDPGNSNILRDSLFVSRSIVGSVNSNRSHFEMTLKDMFAINSRFCDMLEEMITHCIKLQDYERIFIATSDQHVITVIEIESW